MTPEDRCVRYGALLERVAVSVSAYDGAPRGGALLGPRLLFMAALDALPDERLIRLGTAVELLRRATLVHRVPKRETPWPGEDGASFSQTLRGDSLLAESFRLLAADGEPLSVRILSKAMASVAQGELVRHSRGRTVEAAMRLAALYAGAAETGALLSGRTADEARFYAAFGECIGLRHAECLWGLPRRSRVCAAPPGSEDLAALVHEAAGQPDTCAEASHAETANL